MLDLFTIALFQLVTFFGYTPIDQPVNSETTVTKSEVVGSGGWGHDVTSNETTPPPAPISTVGSGGWGHD